LPTRERAGRQTGTCTIWRVFAKYFWQDWLDDRGNPVVVPSDGILGLYSSRAVELTWQTVQEEGRQVGPVLGPALDCDQPTRTYSPMDREYAALFRLFSELDYHDQSAVLAFASEFGLSA